MGRGQDRQRAVQESMSSTDGLSQQDMHRVELQDMLDDLYFGDEWSTPPTVEEFVVNVCKVAKEWREDGR